ncbi:MAG: hypothetical protein IJK33_01105 [Clostridia bacterium]|nr:hypothetical protein [Clostridia bacterium]
MSSIYFYATESDLQPIVDYILSNELSIYDRDGKIHSQLNQKSLFIAESNIKFNYRDTLDYISFDYFQCLSLTKSKEVKSKKIIKAYNHICKIIKEGFVYVKLSRLYVGPDYLQKWRDREFDHLCDLRCIHILEYKVNEYLCDTSYAEHVANSVYELVSNRGFLTIPVCFEKWGISEKIGFGNYVIYKNKDDLDLYTQKVIVSYLIGEHDDSHEEEWIHCMPSSKCIFFDAYKRGGKNKGVLFRVLLDARIVTDPKYNDLVNMFNEINVFLNEKCTRVEKQL